LADRLRLALLAGGWSREREVSVRSGEAVYKALNKERYDVIRYDPKYDLKDLNEAKGDIDLAFILLHGKLGEDGSMQGMLEVLGIPFVGSGVLSSAMAFDKRVAKELYRGRGLRVAKEIILRRGDKYSLGWVTESIGSPAVVKPVAEGSSIGVSICQNHHELKAGIEKAFEYDHEVMVEEYIDGQEITCCVLGNRSLEALPLVEIAPRATYRFFDYEAKYTAGATRETCPASLSKALTEKAQSYGRKAHRALRCDVWSRTDMIVRGEEVYVLETNTIPGMTENSLFPLAARAAGLSLSGFLDRLISLSLELKNINQCD
jgi:D-alanine-D-alanine ligase